jgi:hypothetical protein
LRNKNKNKSLFLKMSVIKRKRQPSDQQLERWNKALVKELPVQADSFDSFLALVESISVEMRELNDLCPTLEEWIEFLGEECSCVWKPVPNLLQSHISEAICSYCKNVGTK